MQSISTARHVLQERFCLLLLVLLILSMPAFALINGRVPTASSVKLLLKEISILGNDDVGPGVMPGSGLQIEWNVKADFPNLLEANCRLRVLADDFDIEN